MKTAELTGALLDYYVARAEGVPAEQLTIRQVPRTDNLICTHSFYDVAGLGGVLVKRVDYSASWALTGPLIEKYRFTTVAAPGGKWTVPHVGFAMYGDAPLQAICRAVVRAAFGDEVEDLPS